MAFRFDIWQNQNIGLAESARFSVSKPASKLGHASQRRVDNVVNNKKQVSAFIEPLSGQI
jgi:hypothetical protein